MPSAGPPTSSFRRMASNVLVRRHTGLRGPQSRPSHSSNLARGGPLYLTAAQDSLAGDKTQMGRRDGKAGWISRDEGL